MAIHTLNVIAEAHVPYLQPLAHLDSVNLSVLPPEGFTPQAVADADALIVRTRTRCNADLLANSRVKFVGTATIGTDHIDLDWCAANGITAANAPGCNAPAVAQYVFATIARLITRPIDSYTIGVVGVGHVGSIVARWAKSMGMNVLLCDPPRQRVEGGTQWSSLHGVAEKADIITFHTPLTRSGRDATFHLADMAFFEMLRRKPIIINAARGPVADTIAWCSAIDCGLCSHAVVDCWEGEPQISSELLSRVDIATPHIAGYSAAGKLRASQMVVDALTAKFGLSHLTLGQVPPVPDSITLEQVAKSYDPMADDAALRSNPEAFEAIRNGYHLRDEA
jgi:erythronate-4-phosphate dehydrogenase